MVKHHHLWAANGWWLSIDQYPVRWPTPSSFPALTLHPPYYCLYQVCIYPVYHLIKLNHTRLWILISVTGIASSIRTSLMAIVCWSVFWVPVPQNWLVVRLTSDHPTFPWRTVISLQGAELPGEGGTLNKSCSRNAASCRAGLIDSLMP